MLRPAGVMLLLAVALSAVVAGPVWNNYPSITIPRMEVLSGYIGDKAWVMGGYDSLMRSVSSVVEEYSFTTSTWTTLATAMPWSLHHSEMAVDPDHPEYWYIVGGFTQDAYTPTTTLWRWDGTSFLTTLAQMPILSGAGSVRILNGKIYYIGGAYTYNELPTYNTLQIYDIATDSWSMGANMTYAREHLATGVVDGKLYAIGGRWGEGQTQLRELQYNEEYDPDTDTWTVKAELPTGRSGCHAMTADGVIYVFGGDDRTFDNVEAYHPDTDTWTCHLPMPYPRHGMGIFLKDDQVFLVSGGYSGGTTLSTSMMSYNVTEGAASGYTCSSVHDAWTNWVSNQEQVVDGVSYCAVFDESMVVYDFGATTYTYTEASSTTTTTTTTDRAAVEVTVSATTADLEKQPSSSVLKKKHRTALKQKKHSS